MTRARRTTLIYRVLGTSGAVVMLISGAVLPASSEVWRPTLISDTSEMVSLTLDDGWRTYGASSSITRHLDPAATFTSSENSRECASFSEPGCSFPIGDRGRANLILPVCESQSQINCLEEFWVGTSSNLVLATQMTPVSGHRVPANPRLKTPEGTLPHLFTTGPTSDGKSKTYVVSPRVLFSLEQGTATAIEFQLSINAVELVRKPGQTPVTFVPATQERRASIEGTADIQCAAVDTDLCAQIIDFEPNTVFRIQVRLPSSINGWLKGRLTDPVVSSNSFGQGGNRFSIEGKPVSVPKMEVQLEKTHPLVLRGDGLTGVTMGNERLTYSFYRADSPFGVKFVSEVAARANDTSGGSESAWYVSTISTYAGNLKECTEKAGEFVGLVTTNAMAFDGGVPEFNDGMLKYNMAGLHYLPDGKTEALGTYDLAIKSDVARCLYGYGSAPISAAISVVGEGEEQKVAVTQVRERDGWLTLSAKGFTYSQNEVRAVVTQPQMRTLSDHPGRATALTTRQKTEIRSVLTKSKGNTKFICTGIRLEGQSESMNRTVRLRAKLACDYAKSLNPKLSTFYQTKTTKARSYSGRVLVVSK